MFNGAFRGRIVQDGLHCGREVGDNEGFLSFWEWKPLVIIIIIITYRLLFICNVASRTPDACLVTIEIIVIFSIGRDVIPLGVSSKQP